MRNKFWARVVVFISASLLLFGLTGTAGAQSIPQVPGLSAASNDCGCPTGSSGIPVSSAMLAPLLPKIPNLEFGFLYYFGKNVRTGRFTADYVLPLRMSADSVVFGEAHAEGWDFWKRSSGTADNRIDLSFGGGYRTMLGDNTFVGVNGFYDTTRLFSQWHSSGGVGLEYAAKVGGSDAVDLNFNWYGNLFNRDSLINAFRNKGNSFDVEAGYSHALFNQSMDLRLKIIGYQFDIGDKVYGWRGGADLTTRDGMFTLRYEHGSDRLNGDYNTVGGFVTVGFQVANLLSGESPFTLPEPVFRSPRDLRRLLGLKVKRNWHQPAAVVQARAYPTGSPCCCTGRVIVRGILINHNDFFVTVPTSVPPGTTISVTWCGANVDPLRTRVSFYFYPVPNQYTRPTANINMSASNGGPVVRNITGTFGNPGLGIQYQEFTGNRPLDLTADDGCLCIDW